MAFVRIYSQLASRGDEKSAFPGQFPANLTEKAVAHGLLPSGGFENSGGRSGQLVCVAQGRRALVFARERTYILDMKHIWSVSWES